MWTCSPTCHRAWACSGRVQADLEKIVGARVDLVPAQDLKPAVRPRAERELVAL
jgi:predicted nucleotidyltransferase